MGDMWHIPTNNTTIRPIAGGGTVVTLHRTAILTIHADGAVTLDSGGHRTTTTKTRMNQCANVMRLGFNVAQRGGVWHVGIDGVGVVPFVDGMTIRPVMIGGSAADGAACVARLRDRGTL